MSKPSDRALATVLLTTHLVIRPAAPLSPKEFWDLLATVEDPSRLLGSDRAGIQAITGVSAGEAERLASLLEGAAALKAERERFQQSGIKIVSRFDEEYPVRLASRLGTGAPPVLHVAGDPELLAQDGVGIVGSRNVGREAREVAEEVAREAVEAGLPVISGVAKGIDRTAMGAALEAQGTVIGLPADSLDRLLKDSSVREPVEGGRLCLATPYAPSAGFSVGGAMGRNKLIYGLSQVTLVVTSDDGTGGTWAGATEALQRNLAPVAVWTGPGAGPGNAELVRKGAIAVERALDVPSVRRTETEAGIESQLRMIF
jgi:predicted Rossmann fold nucleotide-binding protein DprA/Smf involved in DNA uptake